MTGPEHIQRANSGTIEKVSLSRGEFKTVSSLTEKILDHTIVENLKNFVKENFSEKNLASVGITMDDIMQKPTGQLEGLEYDRNLGEDLYRGSTLEKETKKNTGTSYHIYSEKGECLEVTKEQILKALFVTKNEGWAQFCVALSYIHDYEEAKRSICNKLANKHKLLLVPSLNPKGKPNKESAETMLWRAVKDDKNRYENVQRFLSKLCKQEGNLESIIGEITQAGNVSGQYKYYKQLARILEECSSDLSKYPGDALALQPFYGVAYEIEEVKRIIPYYQKKNLNIEVSRDVVINAYDSDKQIRSEVDYAIVDKEGNLIEIHEAKKSYAALLKKWVDECKTSNQAMAYLTLSKNYDNIPIYIHIGDGLGNSGETFQAKLEQYYNLDHNDYHWSTKGNIITISANNPNKLAT